MEMKFKPECPEDLMEAFTWSDTPQGYVFWRHVYEGRIPFHIAIPLIDEMWENPKPFREREEDLENIIKQFVESSTSSSNNGSVRLFAGEHPDYPKMYVKIVRNSDPYLKYAKYAQENHTTNTHLPKISSIEPFTDETKIVVMEKLNEIPLHFIKSFSSFFDSAKCPHVKKTKGMFEFHDTIETLREKFKDYRWDLHKKNWMIRPNGQWVITDPIF